MTDTVTPHKMRCLIKGLKASKAEYQAKRSHMLQVGKAMRANPTSGVLQLSYESAIAEAQMARRDYQHMQLIVSTRRVELGSKWSDRGLINVQQANQRKRK